MKRWEKYDKFLQSGNWHVHSSYTDGKNSVFEMCQKAEELGMRIIVFTEHVSRKMGFRFEDFLADVHAAKDRFNLIVLAGCEAAVTDVNGTLDAYPEMLRQCEIVAAGFHRFPYHEKEKRLHALELLLKNPQVDVWTHPRTLYMTGRIALTLTPTEKERALSWCKENTVLLENNSRYPLDKEFLDTAQRMRVPTCSATSAHSTEELERSIP